MLYLASKDLNSSAPVQGFIATVNAIQLWIFPLRLLTVVSPLLQRNARKSRVPTPAPRAQATTVQRTDCNGIA